MIELQGVSKTYPGSSTPAVEALDLAIPGRQHRHSRRTVGLRQVHDPAADQQNDRTHCGRIIFDGEDVTSVNPDKLRRRIGYVIQQISLLPHRTIR